MSTLLKLEGLALGALALWLCAALDYSWWWYAGLFLAPDLSFVGYAAGPRVGAMVYNVAHHQGTAIGVYLAGVWIGSPWILLAGTVLLGHSAIDRLLGYGLKYPDAFKHTHLDAFAEALS